MPTYESLAAFQRQWAKLDAAQRAAFRRAVAVFIADLKAGESFSPELRVHKLVNTEIWSLTWAKDGRALFRFGARSHLARPTSSGKQSAPMRKPTVASNR